MNYKTFKDMMDFGIENSNIVCFNLYLNDVLNPKQSWYILPKNIYLNLEENIKLYNRDNIYLHLYNKRTVNTFKNDDEFIIQNSRFYILKESFKYDELDELLLNLLITKDNCDYDELDLKFYNLLIKDNNYYREYIIKYIDEVKNKEEFL